MMPRLTLVFLLAIAPALARAQASDLPSTTPYRPSVSTPAEVSVGIRPLGDAMAAAAMNVIESRSQTKIAARGDLPDGFASTLAAVARDALLQTQTPPPRLAVIATSAAIQEAAKSDAVVRFHLKLAEQGMEWTTIGGEEDQRDTLVPE